MNQSINFYESIVPRSLPRDPVSWSNPACDRTARLDFGEHAHASSMHTVQISESSADHIDWRDRSRPTCTHLYGDNYGQRQLGKASSPWLYNVLHVVSATAYVFLARTYTASIGQSGNRVVNPKWQTEGKKQHSVNIFIWKVFLSIQYYWLNEIQGVTVNMMILRKLILMTLYSSS